MFHSFLEPSRSALRRLYLLSQSDTVFAQAACSVESESYLAFQSFSSTVAPAASSLAFISSASALLATDIEKLMLKAVRYRFSDYKTPRTIEFLSDRGSIYRAHSVKNLAKHLGLKSCYTAAYSPESNGMSEALVKTIKRDYVYNSDCFSAEVVLKMIKGGKNITEATKIYRLPVSKIRQHLGNTLIKNGNKFSGRVFDNIEREMSMYEKDEGLVNVVINSSRLASRIGRYFSSVNLAIRNNDDKHLKKFEKLPIADVKGLIHPFETNLNKIFEYEEQNEDSEFFEIYGD